jgi:hypothetical protein
LVTTAKTMKAMPSQATGRQRRDGGRPLGNVSGSRMTRNVSSGAYAHEPVQATTSPPGSDPGEVTRAWRAYSSPPISSVKKTPMTTQFPADQVARVAGGDQRADERVGE